MSTDGSFDEGALNATMAQFGADIGGIAEHFAVGDFVRVYLFNEYAPTVATGVITARNVGLETLTVLFDASFNPFDGEDELLPLVIEYDLDVDGTNSTSSQKRYCYVADVQALMPDGSYARRYA